VAGRHCAQYGGGGLACGDGVRSPPQGSIPSTGLVLSAEEACPLACGACATPEPEPEPETDPCASAPCQHGGTCSVSDASGGGHRRAQNGQCTLAQFSAQVPALNGMCCDGPGQNCAGGLPASCDAECAAVFLPLVNSCGNVLSQFLGPTAQQSLVAQCQASQSVAAGGSTSDGGAYHCSCVAGLGGARCEVTTAGNIAIFSCCLKLVNDMTNWVLVQKRRWLLVWRTLASSLRAMECLVGPEVADLTPSIQSLCMRRTINHYLLI
jgi:hypothetical protein